MQIEPNLRQNKTTNQPSAIAIPTPMAAPPSLHDKLKNLTNLLLLYTFFVSKLLKTLTICVLKGSLFPLTRLYNEHFPPTLVVPKAVPPIVLNTPVKIPKNPQRSIFPYLLGTIGLTIGLTAILYLVKNLVISGSGDTDVQHDHTPPLPPLKRTPFPIKPSTSNDIPWAWLPHALGSGLFLAGLVAHASKKVGTLPNNTPHVPSNPAPYQGCETPQDFLYRIQTCIQERNCIEADVDTAFAFLKDLVPTNCVEENDSLCEAVMRSTFPVFANISPPDAGQFAYSCAGNNNYACQQVIENAIPDLLNALQGPYLKKRIASPCPAVLFQIAHIALNCPSRLNEACASLGEHASATLLANECQLPSSNPDLEYFISLSVNLVSDCVARADISNLACLQTLNDDNRVVENLSARIKDVCNGETELLTSCQLLMYAIDVRLFEPCKNNITPFCEKLMIQLKDHNILAKLFEIYPWAAEK